MTGSNHCIHFDLVILGGGCIGSAILHELGRRGFRDVALLDHGRATQSATAHSGGMLRVFHESPVHVDLALGHWAALAHETNAHAHVLTEKVANNGSLYFFHRSRYDHYRASLKKMSDAGYPFEVMTPETGRARFPQFRWNTDDQAVFEPEGGYLSPVSFVRDLLLAGSRRGDTIFENFEVRRIRSHLNRYHLLGNGPSLTARTLVLAGGARMIPRLNDLGLRLPLKARKISSYLARKTKAGFHTPNFFDRETLEFARLGQGTHVVLSRPSLARLTDSPWEENEIQLLEADDCYAPHRQGVAGQVCGHQNLFMATGWGGTAFKFALEIGRLIADAIESRASERRRAHAIF